MTETLADTLKYMEDNIIGNITFSKTNSIDNLQFETLNMSIHKLNQTLEDGFKNITNSINKLTEIQNMRYKFEVSKNKDIIMEHTGYIPSKYETIKTAVCGICGEISDIIYEDESIDHEFGRHHQYSSYTKCCESLEFSQIRKDTQYPENPEFIKKLLKSDIITFENIITDDEETTKQFTQHNKDYILFCEYIIDSIILEYDLDNKLTGCKALFEGIDVDEISLDNVEKDILIYKRCEI